MYPQIPHFPQTLVHQIHHSPCQFVKIGPPQVVWTASYGISSLELPRISPHPPPNFTHKIFTKITPKIARIWICEFVEFFVVFVHGSVVLGVDLTSHILPSHGFAKLPPEFEDFGPGFPPNREEQHGSRAKRYYRPHTKRYYRSSGTTARLPSGTTARAVQPVHDSGTTARRPKFCPIFGWHFSLFVV